MIHHNSHMILMLDSKQMLILESQLYCFFSCSKLIYFSMITQTLDANELKCISLSANISVYSRYVVLLAEGNIKAT